MSSDTEIRARGLGKKYDLYDSALGYLGGLLFNREARRQRWALRDFDLDARPGDCIGIIGRNGAGKSTLLEIIVGTRTASSGFVEVKGRVAALLALGAGFHPDFTGTENARLSAAAYGLSSDQIDQRLPAIARFAGIEDFMDRPTREYSSGMFARLAFSVCAHVDAEILIIDEILGVGDVRFQQRSMRFLRQFTKNRIVLFVSHNEAAILSLCNRAIWLADGIIAASGSPKETIHAYHKAISRISEDTAIFGETGHLATETCSPIVPGLVSGEKSGSAEFFDFDVEDESPRKGSIIKSRLSRAGKPVTALAGGERVQLSVQWARESGDEYIGFAVRDPLGQLVFYRDTTEQGPAAPTEANGPVEAIFVFRMPYLPSGRYSIDVALFDWRGGGNCLDRKDLTITFSVLSRHISAGMANVPLQKAEILITEPAQ